MLFIMIVIDINGHAMQTVYDHVKNKCQSENIFFVSS